MKKFLILSYATSDAKDKMSSKTPDDMIEGMKQWFAWKDKYDMQVVDIGTPLVDGVQVKIDGNTVGSTKEIIGYMMIQAESREDALTLLKESPLFPYDEGCSIEMHECMAMQ